MTRSGSVHRIILGLLCAVLLSVCVGSAFAVDEIKLPSWPQPFKLMPGDRASFAFPVVKPGDIVVDVTWSGAPLAVYLVDPAGKPVTPVTAQNGPVKISRTMTATDLSKGFLWAVVISDTRKQSANDSQALAVSGQVSAQYPPAELTGLARMVSGLQSNRQTMQRSFQAKAAKFADASKARLAREEQDRKNALSTQAKQLGDRVTADQARELVERTTILNKIKSSINDVPPSGSTARVHTNAIRKPGTGIGALNPALKDGIKIIPAPTLVSVSPGQGYAGDTVSINADNVQGDVSKYQVEFTIGQNVKSLGQVTRIDTVNGKTWIRVEVAEEAPNMTTGFNGQVVIKTVDASTGAPVNESNPLPFWFIVRPRPIVSSVSPTEVRPGTEIHISGSGFNRSCKTHFLFPDGRHEIVQNYDDSTQNMRPWMPSYTSHTTFPVVMYVEKEERGRMVRSEMKDLTCKTTESGIATAAPAAGQAGNTVYLSGYGLDNVSGLVFVPDPGQEGMIFNQSDILYDMSRAWDVKQKSYSSLTATVSGGGISGPVHGKLYGVYNFTKRTNGVAFTLNPIYTTWPVYYRYVPGATVFTMKDGADEFVQIRQPEQQYGSSVWIDAEHHSSLFSGHGGDDTYVMDLQLKNGWQLDHVDWWDNGDDGDPYNAYVSQTYNDSQGRLTIKVHWWVDAPCHQIWYEFTPYVKGPWGVPMK